MSKAADFAPLIIPGAVVVGGTLLAYKFGLLDFRSTAERIKEKDTDIEKITIDTTKLYKPLAAYKSIADNLYKEINSLLLTKDTTLINAVKTLGANELKQVYKDFGKRCDSYNPGLPGEWNFCVGDKHDIFWWFNKTMSGATLDQMKYIWKRSGLGWN